MPTVVIRSLDEAFTEPATDCRALRARNDTSGVLYLILKILCIYSAYYQYAFKRSKYYEKNI